MNRKKIVSLLTAGLLLASALVGNAVAQIEPALPAAGWAPANTPVARHGQLSVDGKFIVDKNGDATQLAGMSLFWSNSDQSNFYDDAIVGWLYHDWNISVIRAAMGIYHKDGGGGSGGSVANNFGYMDNPSKQMERIEVVINAAILRGIYVIVDWHSHDAHSTSTTLGGTNYNRTQQAAAIEFFKAIATKYGSYPNIIYEIYNEPKDVSWSNIATYSEAVIDAIRDIDENNIIIVGTESYSSNPQNGPISNPSGKKRTNLAYSLHFYANGYAGNSNAHQGYMERATTTLEADRPVFVSEFGAVDADGAGSVNASNTTAWFDYMDNSSRMISWVNWAIQNKGEASAALKPSAGVLGNWNLNNDLTESGRLIRTRLVGRTPKNPTSYTITVSATPLQGGSVNVDGSKATYGWGDKVTISAAEEDGWEFVRWTGDAKGSAKTLAEYSVKAVSLNIGAEFYDGGVIRNGHFWHGIDGTWGVSSSGSFILSAQNGRLNITPPSGSTEIASSRYVLQNGISLTGGRKYKLTFKAMAGESRDLNVRVESILQGAPLQSNRLNYTFSIGTSMPDVPYEVTFDMPTNGTTTTAELRFYVGGIGGAANVSFAEVRLADVGDATSIVPQASVVRQARWSISKTTGNITLRGPAEAGAMVMFYDVRGKAVRTVAAKDGMNLGRGLPAGNYFVVVKNAAGKEVLKSRVSMVK